LSELSNSVGRSYVVKMPSLQRDFCWFYLVAS